MKAHKLIGKMPGGNKLPMSELVPLRTPLLVEIFPVYACNFTCRYCLLSIKKSERNFISDTISMKLELYKKCIDDLKRFPDTIKTLRFVGMGEPLLHKHLPEMIKCAYDAGIAERIEVITNGSLLTPTLSHKLIDSGLTKLLISVQGTSAQKYWEIANVRIDLDTFINNIGYFYDHRGNSRIHIKVADCALEDKEDENRFFELFGNVCDTIGIEHIGPIHDGVEYNNEMSDKPINQYGETSADIKICSQPFYTLHINPDGNVVPCYSLTYPKIIGNCQQESLFDLWNGEVFNKLRLRLLNGMNSVDDICCGCNIFKHRASASDDLHIKNKELKVFYSR